MLHSHLAIGCDNDGIRLLLPVTGRNANASREWINRFNAGLIRNPNAKLQRDGHACIDNRSGSAARIPDTTDDFADRQ